MAAQSLNNITSKNLSLQLELPELHVLYVTVIHIYSKTAIYRGYFLPQNRA